MSRKSAQRFCDNDMHKNKGLKRILNTKTRPRAGFFVATGTSLIPADWFRAPNVPRPAPERQPAARP
ncbi:hypothetical protein EJ066_00485 [Mesorhizobium sp. M9A.F.Ca.ET.002.03.1.2]|nr:hypothetical protein EJ066_00485 [Mesorhizobium sp. M9A.F.Ca.ET.002.03.1.2]